MYYLPYVSLTMEVLDIEWENRLMVIDVKEEYSDGKGKTIGPAMHSLEGNLDAKGIEELFNANAVVIVAIKVADKGDNLLRHKINAKVA